LYLEAIAEDPKNARTQYDLALALDRLGDYRGVTRCPAKRYSRLDDDFAAPHNQLGFLSLQTGQIADAKSTSSSDFLWIRICESQNKSGCALRASKARAQAAKQLFRQAAETILKWTSVS